MLALKDVSDGMVISSDLKNLKSKSEATAHGITNLIAAMARLKWSAFPFAPHPMHPIL